MRSIKYRRASTAILICAVTVAAGCDAVQSDWSNAQAENSIRGYQGYLLKHNAGQQAKEAVQRIADLEDDRDWHSADSTNTLESYRQYLYDHPDGLQASIARQRVLALERASAWKSAQLARTGADGH